MTRKSWFWLLLVIAAASSSLLAVRHFADAFPLVDLDLEMQREEALEQARAVAARGVGPARFRQAASFERDQEVQSFVELEAGGREAFRRMLAAGRYAAYTWRVRHFAEGEVHEATLHFTPAGELYGFRETLAEDAPGPALPPAAARRLAEERAATFGVDLAGWRMVEQGAETRAGGRVDHRFTYELDGETLGEGRYRLRLELSGARLTAVSRFVEVPEAFTRRFAEMRSDNDALAAGAGVAMTLLYLLAGCVGGLVFLLRRHALEWRTATAWGVFVALLQAVAALAEWPQLWFGYDTAVGLSTFASQRALVVLASFVGNAMLLAVSFMVAESLGRLAFPRHPQLWRVWSVLGAQSREVAGTTIAGYLLVGIFFAYEVALYFFTSRTLGWWSPADHLADPNVLASHLPWLSALAPSLQAGFWEECLFRAVPLAGAALVGSRLGGARGRSWALGITFVAQALIFGAAHANYPTEPAWARVVELIAPSFLFAGLYLIWGLLPAIVLHFAYDVVWFALPLFVARGEGVLTSQILVVALTLIPLWVVLWARGRRSWSDLPEPLRNAGWVATVPQAAVAEPVWAPIPALGAVARRISLVVGLAGLVAWGLWGGEENLAPPLALDRAGALGVARTALAERGFTPAAPWRELASVEMPGGNAAEFVWREGGPEAYRQLLGSFLPPPRWQVRVARFEGDVAERAEEWNVYVGPAGAARVRHQLPEGRAGASLDEAAARALAETALRERYALDPAALEPVSAEPRKRPERTDWSFVWRDGDPGHYPLATGEARIGVDLAGDEVTETFRFVHVPEAWERAERSRQSAVGIVRAVSFTVVGLVFVAAIGVALVAASRRELALPVTWVALAGLLAAGLLGAWNQWPELLAQLDTAQPWGLQVGIAATFLVLALLVRAVAVALLAGFVSRHEGGPADRLALPLGLEWGAALAGLGAVATTLGEPLSPPLADITAAGTRVPFLGQALAPLGTLLAAAALLLFVVALLDRLTAGLTRRPALAAAACVVLGLAAAGTRAADVGGIWIPVGLGLGVALFAAWAALLRKAPAALPLAVALALALGGLREGAQQAFPGAFAGAVAGSLLVLICGAAWTRWLALQSTMADSAGD